MAVLGPAGRDITSNIDSGTEMNIEWLDEISDEDIESL